MEPEQSSTSQRYKPNVKISHTITKSSTNIKSMQASPSKQGIRFPSNYLLDPTDKMQFRSPAVKLDKTTGYEKLRVNTTQHYFRDDWGGVTAIRYLQDGERMAVGFHSGDLQICGSRCGPPETILKGWEGNDSITCIRFHPKKPSLLYASSTAGTVMRRDLEDGSEYNDYFVSEKKNEIYSMCFSESGKLVTVGRDAIVRMYDAESHDLCGMLGRASIDSTNSSGVHGHEKRIYCVRSTGEPSVIVTGGWDGVRVWDSRAAMVVRSIAGPFIFGDSVDVSKGVILTASCEAENCLQLWDLGSGMLMDNVSPGNKRLLLHGEYPYVARFYGGDPTGDIVLYGVAGMQLVSVKDASVLYLMEDEKPVVAVDSTEKRLAFGGKSNNVMNCRVVIPESDLLSSAFSFASRTISARSDQSEESKSDEKKDEREEEKEKNDVLEE